MPALQSDGYHVREKVRPVSRYGPVFALPYLLSHLSPLFSCSLRPLTTGKAREEK